MYLKHLSLTNFRLFIRLDMEMPRRILLLIGDNAQGKTSFLESIYYLSTFTSFHTQVGRQLINFKAVEEDLAVSRIVADFQRGSQTHRIEVRLIKEPNGTGKDRFRKEILVDSVHKTAQEGLGYFNAVLFLPQMTRILEGGPEERRRYLNLVVCQAFPDYAAALAEYSQGLVRRNALLKQLAERGGDRKQLLFWDDLLAKRGSQIIYRRIHALNELENHARRIHQRLTNAQEVLRMDYQPSFDPIPHPNGQIALPLEVNVDRERITQEQIYLGFMERLQSLQREEIARGQTCIGPHRDEIRFLSNRIDLGEYGSRGQIRTALMSLKLAEAAWLEEKTGQTPVILLDEMMSELDLQRRKDLLNYLEDVEQALITTTDLRMFPENFEQRCTVWRINQGVVQPLQTAQG